MQYLLLMISSEAPAGGTAVEPARTPIRKLGSPNCLYACSKPRGQQSSQSFRFGRNVSLAADVAPFPAGCDVV
jgi:hypothetical protein